jgi:hypothetical protein
VRGLALAIVAAFGLAALPASASRQSIVRYKVVSAKATATLSFHKENADQSEVVDGTAALSASQKGTGTGSLPGQALVSLKGTLKERVKTKRTPSGASPYQETCANSHKVTGRGGITLKRIGRSVEAGWAFPQARLSFCRGPKASKAITLRMKRLYAAGAFDHTRTTVVIAGSGKTRVGTTRVVYRWRATVKLTRS